MPAQVLVDEFDREVRVFLLVETPHPVQFALRRTPVRSTPKPLVAQALNTLRRVTDALAAEVAAGQTQKVARFFRGQTTLFVLLMRIQETPHMRLP